MSWLLDTNVLSELTKLEPNQRVIEWLQSHEHDQVFLSVLTIGELQYGIERLPPSKKKNRLHGWLERTILTNYSDHILPINSGVMIEWARLRAIVEQEGRTLPIVDSLIAATALRNKLTIVTRNVKDYAGLGVELFDPWS